MKRYQIVRDYLSFNRSELRGIIILLIILLLVATANELLPEENTLPGVNFPGLEKELQEFEAAIRKSQFDDSVNRALRFSGRWPSKGKRKDSIGSGAFPPRPFVKIDINKADTLEFQRLNGIGPSYARRIVFYRNKLGGFISCRQLLEVWGVDTSLFNRIKDHVMIISDSVQKIDINTMSFKEMLKHPYFPYELTRSVILYRQKNKMFRSVDELKLVEGVCDSVFRKISAYVKIK
ncbi:MAG: ComEA family DNA-binding protein [Bacteroidales bacterium]